MDIRLSLNNPRNQDPSAAAAMDKIQTKVQSTPYSGALHIEKLREPSQPFSRPSTTDNL